MWSYPTQNPNYGPVIQSGTAQPASWQCQLAHGDKSQTIYGITDVYDMHRKIAHCFHVNSVDIMYCTRNCNQVVVDQIITGIPEPNDYIFAHIRGKTKRISVQKTGPTFGATLSDNNGGTVFIRSLIPEGAIDQASRTAGGVIMVGDQIVNINGVSLLGYQHESVGEFLRGIPILGWADMQIISSVMAPTAMPPAQMPMAYPSSMPPAQMPLAYPSSMPPAQMPLAYPSSSASQYPSMPNPIGSTAPYREPPLVYPMPTAQQPVQIPWEVLSYESKTLIVRKILRSKKVRHDEQVATLILRYAPQCSDPLQLSEKLKNKTPIPISLNTITAIWHELHPRRV